MSDITLYPGDTFPNLKGKIEWPALIDLTDVIVYLHVGPYGAASAPFYGLVTTSDIVEEAVGSSLVWEYDVETVDTVKGEYDVLARVVFDSGEIETVSLGRIKVTTFQ